MRMTRGAVPSRGTLRLLAAVVLLQSATAAAWEFNFGEARLNIDTTVSIGTALRMERPDPKLLGPSHGGVNPDAENWDEGNFNYKRYSLVNAAARATIDGEFTWKGFGAFARANGFFDLVNALKPELADSRGPASRDLQLLDGYVRWNGAPLGRELSIRLGYQVVNWGESIFFQSGIAAVNGADLRRLRVPGSEIRDAFLPSPMAFLAIEPINNLSVQAFVNAKPTFVRMDACGTYYATSDVICEGTPKQYQIGQPFGIKRGPDVQPGWFQKPEYGVALKYVAAPLNSTEFALYYVNHHLRYPIIAGRAPAVTPGIPSAFAYNPTDISMFGFSFNTNIPRAGLTIAGEYAHRPHMPFQGALPDLIRSALGPSLGLAGLASPNQVFDPSFKAPIGQASVSFLEEFGRTFMADNMILLVEVAASNIWRMPSRPLDGPRAPTPFAFGYTARLGAEYFNVFGAVTFSPFIAFSHDVIGTSPTGGNFIQDRTGLTLGLTATWLQRLSGTISYSGFYGAGRANIRRDKDFMSFVLSYQI